MASSTNYFTGKYGKATVNGTDVNVIGWKVSPEAERHDVTSTRTSGFGGVIYGIKRCTYTLDLQFDAAANPLDATPGLSIGTTLTTVKLYLDGTSSPFWLFPSSIVFKTPMESKVGDKTTITVEAENDGTFTAPTGNFTPAA